MFKNSVNHSDLQGMPSVHLANVREQLRRTSKNFIAKTCDWSVVDSPEFAFVEINPFALFFSCRILRKLFVMVFEMEMLNKYYTRIGERGYILFINKSIMEDYNQSCRVNMV